MECIFCNLATGDESQLVYSDEQVIAFNDINPQAPHHVLIVPRQHIATLNAIDEVNHSLIGHLVRVGALIAKEKGIANAGYRLLFNCNEDGGQTVYHIHLHLLGGRQMHWPPG